MDNMNMGGGDPTAGGVPADPSLDGIANDSLEQMKQLQLWAAQQTNALLREKTLEGLRQNIASTHAEIISAILSKVEKLRMPN
jgi:tagatose-1,6-bisphosphate aldolase